MPRLKRIHINRHIIAANRKRDHPEPPITVKVGRENHYGYEVRILGASTVIYRPEKPLKCGAAVWIETKGRVFLDNTQRIIE